jgi:hypothetical protein
LLPLNSAIYLNRHHSKRKEACLPVETTKNRVGIRIAVALESSVLLVPTETVNGGFKTSVLFE